MGSRHPPFLSALATFCALLNPDGILSISKTSPRLVSWRRLPAQSRSLEGDNRRLGQLPIFAFKS